VSNPRQTFMQLSRRIQCQIARLLLTNSLYCYLRVKCTFPIHRFRTIGLSVLAVICWTRLADSFSVLAIIISCVGLFGLSMFTAEQRCKKIGVRKVIGASRGSIVAMLSREIVRLIVLAALLAAPITGIAMNGWLKGFAYRAGNV
jgi:hypothetical protein